MDALPIDKARLASLLTTRSREKVAELFNRMIDEELAKDNESMAFKRMLSVGENYLEELQICAEYKEVCNRAIADFIDKKSSQIKYATEDDRLTIRIVQQNIGNKSTIHIMVECVDLPYLEIAKAIYVNIIKSDYYQVYLIKQRKGYAVIGIYDNS